MLETSGESAASQQSIEPTAPEASEEIESSYPFPQQPTSLPSFSSLPSPPLPSASFPDEPQTPFGEEHPTTPTFPSFLNTPTTVPSAPSSYSNSDISAPPTPSAPVIQSPSLPLPPPTHQTAFLPPPTISPHATQPAFPSAVFPTIPILPQAQTLTNWNTSSLPVSVPSPVSASVEKVAGVPLNLDPSVVSRIQKHLKWSGSALNYDDYDTARKELKAALLLLGE